MNGSTSNPAHPHAAHGHAHASHGAHAGHGGSTGGGCPFHQGTAAPSLADVLREATKDAHARAEKHPRQSRMVRGACDRAEYATWLAAMEKVWSALDDGLPTAASREPRLAAMVKPFHARGAAVRADLAHLGTATPPGAASAGGTIASRVRTLAESGSPALVGLWYVLEGSTNGGRYIARGLAPALGLTGPQGLSSLDPHGEATRERWQAWRADLDSQKWTESERAAMVAEASATFDAIHDLMEKLDGLAPAKA